MASEIQVTTNFKVSNGSLKFTWSPGTQSITQTNARGGQPGTITVATDVATLIDTGDLTSPGVALFVNLDSSNFVQIGLDDDGNPTAGFLPFMKLKPGEGFVLRLDPSAAFYALADTAACDLFVAVFDD